MSRNGKKPIRVFLFDLGNVIVRFDHMIAAQKISDLAGVSPEELFSAFYGSPLVIDHDEGKITTEQFFEGIKEKLGLNIEFGTFLEIWNDIFEEDGQMAQLIRELLKTYPVYLISNTNKPHFEFCKKTSSVLDELTGLILSYEEGVLKPHPAIYQKALKMAQVPADQIFYVDDRQDLIEAARELGFQTHQFSTYQALHEELDGRGIDLP